MSRSARDPGAFVGTTRKDIATMGAHIASTHRPSDPRRRHLERLGEAVEAKTDLRAHVREASPSGPPVLRIVNPAATDLSEEIACDLVDERWSLVWSWGDALGPADAVDDAVSAIERVLTVRS